LIKNVIFDVGRVIYQWDLRYLFAQLIDDPIELDWFLKNVVTEEWHFRHDAGTPLAEMIPQRQAEFPDHAHLIDIYAKRFNDTIPGPVEGTHAIIEELHGRSVPLFAITNFGAEFWDGFRPTAPIFDVFTDIVVSGREKLVKPDPAIYALAVQRFGIDPASTIFIDDNLANIQSGRKFGLNGHHFTDAGRLRGELNKLGLLG